MKNIHVLSTDKPSRLKQNKITKKLSLVNKGIDLTAYKPFNINITNDEEIKEGNFFLGANNVVYKFTSDDVKNGFKPKGKKIILTTDPDLIKDGVQAIDDDFLEWFVKNPSCEEVEIRKEYITPLGDIVETCYDNERLNYKIIIPKEEPKQEERYSEEEVELIANEMVNWAIDNIGNPFPQSGKKFDEVIAKYKKQ